jgi:hypothetical protein
MKTRLIAVLLFFFVVSCGGESSQTINIEGRYRLTLPEWMTVTKDLNEDASLQYQSTAKEFYAIVIDEPKANLQKVLAENNLSDDYSSNLKGYSQFIIDGMDRSISVDKIPPFAETSIQGLPARELSFEGLSSGYKVYWKLAFIEGKDHYYQVMVWTLAQNQKKYEKEMNTIVKSFTETNKGKK